MSERPPEPEPDGRRAPDPTVPISSLGTSGGTLGPYFLRELIGSGGMGEVWRAEQTSPVRRTVALKLIKAGMDSREVLARFEAERQALALMDHPCIAKVFDAGTTPQGRPYFAMEYVQGVPITEYCDRRRLTTYDRLQLFLRVCESVQHAHQKAVLHRDLKPGNILVEDVDGRPSPKIIDFGVAKATTQKLTEKTMYTAMGQLIGTPEYMSPEQGELTGEDVDTRTDVYSLGVVLYELLAGALPFDPAQLRKAGFEGMIRILREHDPPRPSTRLSTLGETTTLIAERRSTMPRRLSSQLKGDLDWIVMRALEKDRNRRYPSARELAHDVERHLNDEPVLAGPPSAAYRTSKFIRRNRVGVTVFAAAVTVLIAFTVTTGVQSMRVAKERDRANREAESSERVSTFLADMLGDVDPQRFGNTLVHEMGEQIVRFVESNDGAVDGSDEARTVFEESLQGVSRADLARDLLEREILGRAVISVDEELTEDPLLAARLYHSLGETYQRLGMHENAEHQLLRAVEIRLELLGPDDPKTLSARHDLAVAMHSASDSDRDEARRIFSEVREGRRRVLGPDHPETLTSLSWQARFEREDENFVRADSLCQHVLAVRRRVLGDDDSQTLQSMTELAAVRFAQERHAEADSLRSLAYQTAKRVLGPADRTTLELGFKLAVQLDNQERFEESLELHKEIFEVRRRTLGSEHGGTIHSLWWVGHVYDEHLYRFAEAEDAYKQILALRLRARGPGDALTTLESRRLARLYLKTGRKDSADSIMILALAESDRHYGPDHPQAIKAKLEWARLLSSNGHRHEGIRIREDILPRQRSNPEVSDQQLASALEALGNEFRWAEEYAKAEPLLMEAREIYQKDPGPESRRFVVNSYFTAWLYDSWGRHREAEQLFKAAHTGAVDVMGPDHRSTVWYKVRIADSLVDQGKVEEARPWIEEFFTAQRRMAAERDRDKALYAHWILTMVPEPFKDFDEALHYAELANQATDYRDPEFVATLAKAQFAIGRLDDAIATQRAAIALFPAEARERIRMKATLQEYETARDEGTASTER